MKQRFGLFVGLTVVLFAGILSAFETSRPEAEGVSSRAVLNWVNAVESDVDALHSFVLVRHGKVIAEGWWTPYEKSRPHMLYSLSKSFTSTAVGLAVDEGKLSPDDKVITFFPDKLPAQVGENLARMRVRDLLCMGSGNHNDTMPPMKADPAGDWVRIFLAQPVEHEPGTYFRYNTGATFMLSAIVQKTTGQRLIDYLFPRLFEPLGIQEATWETNAQGINTGGYGLKVKTRDIAALGQLYLQKGRWNGKQLLSEKWVEMASSKQISNGDKPESDWSQGYGFQFWRCRHNAFRGDGAFGQYCLVMPDQDAVLAITSGLGDMQKVLTLVWTHLLPAMGPTALAPDAETQARLTEKLAALTLRPVKGGDAQTYEKDVRGKVYLFPTNELGLAAFSLNRDGKGVFFKWNNVHGEQRIAVGHGQWVKGDMIFEKALSKPLGGANGRQAIAASGAWIAPDLYQAQIYFCETPYRLTVSCRFKKESLSLDLEYNVSFDVRKWRLVGQPSPLNK